MKATGYMRLSVRDQSRYSLEYQEQSIRDYCVRNNIELTALFKDNGESSYNSTVPIIRLWKLLFERIRGRTNTSSSWTMTGSAAISLKPWQRSAS